MASSARTLGSSFPRGPCLTVIKCVNVKYSPALSSQVLITLLSALSTIRKLIAPRCWQEQSVNMLETLGLALSFHSDPHGLSEGGFSGPDPIQLRDNHRIATGGTSCITPACMAFEWLRIGSLAIPLLCKL